MTREEQINGLYELKQYLMDNPIKFKGYKSLPITLLDYAIKALEQEPILDKIRAEIEEKADGSVGEIADGLYDALEIIDKYTAESEG